MTKFLALLFGMMALEKIGIAHEKWVRMVSPNFEVYTTGDATSARGVLKRFEQMRSLFLTMSSDTIKSPLPVRIFMFQSEKEYKNYAPPNSDGFHVSGIEREFIAMNGASEKTYGVVIPLYVHILIRHTMRGPCPVWLASGIADFYSSVRIQSLEVIMGYVIPQYEEFLKSHLAFNFEILFSNPLGLRDSKDFDRRTQFYAESWALAHMLLLSPDYQPHLQEFISRLLAGSSAQEAFAKTYDKTLDRVHTDLDQHLRLFMHRGARVKIDPPEAVSKAPAEELPWPKPEIALAELRASMAGKQELARLEFEAIQEQKVSDCRIDIALAYIALQQRRLAEARTYFERAFPAGCESAPAHTIYAELAQANSKTAEEHLQRAVTLNPNYLQAWRDLAAIARLEKKYPLAIEYLSAAVKLKSDDLTTWVLGSRTYLDSGHCAEALASAKKARSFATGDDEASEVAKLEGELSAKCSQKIDRARVTEKTEPHQ